MADFIMDGSDGHTKESALAGNQHYLNVVSSGEEGRRKVSELHEDQFASYLRETTVYDRVMTPRTITPAECMPGIESDTLYKLLYLQPELRTFLSSMEALPTEVQEIFIPRILMGFYRLQSPKVVLNDLNLLAYPFPVAKQVEDLMGPSMHEAIDWFMHSRLEQTIAASAAAGGGNISKGVQAQADIQTNNLNSGFRGQIERDDITTLQKKFIRQRLSKILIAEQDYLDFQRFKLSDFGDEMVSRVFTDGLSTDTVQGVQMIRTIKTDFERGDLLRPGNLYAFPDENVIGRSYILQGLQFFIERDHQFLFYDAHQIRGFVWAVASWLHKLELYNGGLDLDGNPQAGSDSLWGSPEDVTFKDYYNASANLQRPSVSFA